MMGVCRFNHWRLICILWDRGTASLRSMTQWASEARRSRTKISPSSGIRVRSQAKQLIVQPYPLINDF
jgi:hypothetical protein